MKVREAIWIIEEDGWFLVATKAAIGSSSIPASLDVLRSPESRRMIWRRALARAS
jgi:hypothetical protein